MNQNMMTMTKGPLVIQTNNLEKKIPCHQNYIHGKRIF